MAGDRDRESGKGQGGEAPRTDLGPTRDPYYEGYFGTEEEEGVVREEEAKDERAPDPESEERKRRAAEEAAGGDREIG